MLRPVDREARAHADDQLRVRHQGMHDPEGPLNDSDGDDGIDAVAAARLAVTPPE
jgi:hypothetical protein